MSGFKSARAEGGGRRRPSVRPIPQNGDVPRATTSLTSLRTLVRGTVGIPQFLAERCRAAASKADEGPMGVDYVPKVLPTPFHGR